MEQPSWATPSVGEWQTVLACTPTSLSAAARASLCATKAFDVGLHKCRLADWDSSKRFAMPAGWGSRAKGRALLRGRGGGRSRRRHGSRS